MYNESVQATLSFPNSASPCALYSYSALPLHALWRGSTLLKARINPNLEHYEMEGQQHCFSWKSCGMLRKLEAIHGYSLLFGLSSQQIQHDVGLLQCRLVPEPPISEVTGCHQLSGSPKLGHDPMKNANFGSGQFVIHITHVLDKNPASWTCWKERNE